MPKPVVLIFMYLGTFASAFLGVILPTPESNCIRNYRILFIVFLSFVILAACTTNFFDAENNNNKSAAISEVQIFQAGLTKNENKVISNHFDKFVKKDLELKDESSEKKCFAFRELLDEISRGEKFKPSAGLDKKADVKKPKPEIAAGQPIEPSINVQLRPNLKVLVLNYTKNEKEFKEFVNADRGDELYYRIAINNPTKTTLKDLAAYIQIPFGMSYVKGYSKLSYTDENNKDRLVGIGDYIASADGGMIGSLPPMHYEYILYKIKVSPDAPSGTYATGNMVFNGADLKIGANDALVKVDVLE